MLTKALFCAALCFSLACSGGEPEEVGADAAKGGGPGGEDNGKGPRFLDLGVDVSTVTEYEQRITFSAVVTDPDGIEDVIGGVLEDETFDVNIGAFSAAAQEGAYSITVLTKDLSVRYAGESFDYGEALEIPLRAKFFDSEGNQSIERITIRYSCDNFIAQDPIVYRGIISGRCRDHFRCYATGSQQRCKSLHGRLTYNDICAALNTTCGDCKDGARCEDLAKLECVCGQ